MSEHDHDHDHHDHHEGCKHHHHADETPAVKVGEYPRTISGAWQKTVDDTKSIFENGINRNAKPKWIEEHKHGNHVHEAHWELNNKVTDIEKLALLAGATVSLGVAIHGVRNVVRGVAGWEDKELDEKYAPSVQYTVVGAAETVGGLALMKRLLTGTFKMF